MKKHKHIYEITETKTLQCRRCGRKYPKRFRAQFMKKRYGIIQEYPDVIREK